MLRGYVLDVLTACCRLAEERSRKIGTAQLAILFDTTAKTIAVIGKREIIVSAGKRGRWQCGSRV
jgi:hypothetical protein